MILVKESLREALSDGVKAVRAFTHELCQPLAGEDYVIQSMPDVSPTKWHLAHTTWFFETFVLKTAVPDYQSLHPQYDYLFNSYYNAVGERHARPRRGLLSRPTVKEVYEYRQYIDERLLAWLQSAPQEQIEKMAPIVTLGLHHEQQHQELIVTDFKHVLAENPLDTVYRERPPAPSSPVPLNWIEFAEGVEWVGFEGEGFSFDNEGPRHRQFLERFWLASRPVSNREYLQFIEAGGYQDPRWWLSAGHGTVTSQGWQAPLYWKRSGQDWVVRTLSGTQPLHPDEPVCHVSYFEAEAYARWAGARLPTEAEWEVAARNLETKGNFAESGQLHPLPGDPGVTGLQQMFGDVWEWTQSSYAPYPGFQAVEGALGEYNGKFMCNQYVLRGGSCATPESHIRATYRNFFPADSRWQFMGIRLARGPLENQ